MMMMMDAVCISPFVLKTYEMVSDPSTDTLVSWGVANNSFVVINLFRFSQELLPKYFKHNNFSSFVRQLNTYGFRKVDPDRWEFASEHFLRGQKHLLQNIVRRRNHLGSGGEGRSSVQGSVSGDVELQNQVEKLRHERNAMAMDLAELKHSQKAIDEEMREMNRRLHVTEKRPRKMMAFLAKVIENPMILARMKGSGVLNQRLSDDGRSKKRRLMAAAAEREEDYKKQSASSLPYLGYLGGKKDEMVIHFGDDEGEDQNDVIQLNSLEVSPISSAKSGDMAFHDMGMNNVITGSRHDQQTFWGEEEEGPVLIENIRPPTDYVFEYQGLLPGCPPTRSLSGTLVGTGLI